MSLIYTGTIGQFPSLSELAPVTHLTLLILRYGMLLDGNTRFKPNTIFGFQRESCPSILLPVCNVECLFHDIRLHPPAPLQEVVGKFTWYFITFKDVRYS